LVRTTHIDPVHLYMIDAWMGFVPNLLVAEWWIRSRAPRFLPPVSVRSGRSALRQGPVQQRSPGS
jgi:hypothetical protein